MQLEKPAGTAPDLLSHLHFDPEGGNIWLAGRRMLLLHATAFALLRREIVDMVGIDRARALFTRQGHNSGAMDAESASRIRGAAPISEMFAVGPELHMLQGMVRSEAIRVHVDTATGAFDAEYLWKSSSECGAHIEAFGIGAKPAGWSQIGYASGYSSVFLGRPILFREVECIAIGHPHCRIIGRPQEEWPDAEDDIRYMRSEQLGTLARAMGSSGGSAARERGIVGASSGFNLAFDMLRHVADTDAVVLFLGESGVGKEIFARNLHSMGARADGPFVAVNCAALPESLLEAELFGVEKGAFTGASASRPGRFERAEGGTLFLDEIGTLSLTAQAKLLRAIQEGEYERVGGVSVRHADVRIVAATNADLRAAVDAGAFRADLFYRLNVFPIRIPPLRERRADLPLLMQHFLALFGARHRKTIPGFEEKAIAAMLRYDWPGNVRELENVIERGVIMAHGGEALGLHHLFVGGEAPGATPHRLQDSADAGGTDEPMDLITDATLDHILQSGLTLAGMEDRLVAKAVALAGGNKTRAASLLGLTRAQLLYRLNGGR